IIYAKASILKRMIQTDPTKIDKDKAVEVLDKIEKTADRISKIIRGLRSIARDGEHDPFQSMPVQALISDTVELCRHRLTNKDIGKGTGLGLSISKGIAESHHGTLFLDPHLKQTRFVLRLPRRQADAKPRRIVA